MKMTIQAPSVSGLCWVDIAAGAPWRQAFSATGEALPCQFIPAPFDGPLAGRLLVQTRETTLTLAQGPQGSFVPGCDWVDAQGGRLTLKLGPHELPFADAVLNGWSDEELPFGYPKGNEAFEPAWGAFPLVNDKTQVSRLDGPLADVARLITPLYDLQTGLPLAGVRACCDVVRFMGLPLAQMLLCFDGPEPAAVLRLFYGQLELPMERCLAWRGGPPEVSGAFPEGIRKHGERADDDGIGFPAQSFLGWAALTLPEGEVAYLGGQPALSGEDGFVRLRPDVDGARRDGMGRDLREFDTAAPLCTNLWLASAGEDLSAAVGRLPAWVPPAQPELETLELTAGDLRATLALTGGGVDLVSLTDNRTGQSWLEGAGNNLLAGLLRRVGGEEQYTVGALSGWRSVTALPGPGRLTLLFAESEDPALAGVGVTLTAFCDETRSRIAWQVDLLNASETVSWVQADYPRLHYDFTADSVLFDANGPGALLTQQGRLSAHKHYIYPTEQSAIPFLAVYRTLCGRGLYMGVHDGTGCYKTMRSELSAFTQRGHMVLVRPVEGIGEPLNGCRAPGQGVWQLFDGDWYDAARIYRQWALAHAGWVPPLGDDGRVTGCEWMKKAPFWFNISVDNPRWVEETLEAAQDMGVPVACHVYNWHQIPFDNDYPHYFPAKEEFLQKAPILQQAGLKLMPYINGRLWDMHDRLNEDYLFTAMGRAGATKGRAGKPVRESFLSREIDGSLVQHAVMCPSSAVWQEVQRELVRRLYEEAGVDGVYIDQVAAAPPILCMDKSHSHRPGGGCWWFDAYDHFFDHMRRAVPPGKDGGFMVECSGEVYMGCADGLLSWGWQHAYQVPAFGAVYGGVATVWGRHYAPSQDDVALRILGSQQLLFGDSMGWLSPSMYLKSPHRAFYRRMVQARYRHNDFYYAGAMERPPRVTGGDAVAAPAGLWGPLQDHYPAVNAALWRRVRDGARALFITNVSGKPQAVDIALPEDGPVSLEGDLTGTFPADNGRLALTLPPYAVVTGLL